MPKEEVQKKTALLVDLCVTGAKNNNGSTVWLESVCLNPPLTSLVVLWAGSEIASPALPVWSPVYLYIGYVYVYGQFLQRQGMPIFLADCDWKWRALLGCK